MSRVNDSTKKLKKLWQGFSENEKIVTLYLAYTSPPASIDILSSILKTTAVATLNLLEQLRKKRIVHESKEYGKGFYVLSDMSLRDFVATTVSLPQARQVLKNILNICASAIPEGPDRTLILGELYWHLGDTGDGLEYIKKAADLLYKCGEKEKAASYYSYALKIFAEYGLAGTKPGEFLDSILMEFVRAGHLLPPDEQIHLFTKAQEVARQNKEWRTLTKITLAMGQLFREGNQLDKALLYFNDAWKLAEATDDLDTLRTVVLHISNSLFWKGRISEAIQRYEKVVGNLEEFGDDETTLKSGAMLGWCYVICGRVSRGLGMIDAIRGKAESFHLDGASVFAGVVKALSLMEVRRVSEAELCLEGVLSSKPAIDDHYLLSASYGCLAYACSFQKQYEKAFEWHKKLSEHTSFLGLTYHTGSYVFEYLYELEMRGFFLPEMNYDSEINRMINGDDLYMKGVALRYKAIKNVKVRELKGRAFLDLRKSEKHLKMIGAEIELARTWIILGDAYLKEGEVKVALSYLEKAWALFSAIDKSLFPKDLLVIMMPQEEKVEFMTERIISINESLAAVRDLPMFLERVINLAMDFTMAMRGAFFEIDKANKPRIVASRNLDPMLLKAEQFKIIEEVIGFVARNGAEAIMPGLNDRGNVSDEVLFRVGIHSFICMPAKLGDQTYGYLYLDNRLGGEAFPDSHLPYVRLLCNQIAIGLSNINIYNEIREMKDRFEEEATFYKREMGIANPLETIIGQSEAMKTVLGQIRQVAPTDSSVLIVGETGVGKELVAKAIHNLSSRKSGPFIPVNLAALPHELVASELFGHEKGAFTGANERYKGRFELAHGGTIFLDEIGDLPQSIQVKLLRVLQEGVFERLGSAKPIRSDFRVIAATNKDLLWEIEKSTFRQDLYYRLNVFPIRIPLLRDRKEDILLIARYFIEKFSRRMGKKMKSVTYDELKKLASYRWPGNVRELEHFIERAVILSDGEQIKFPSLEQPFEGQPRNESQDTPRPLAEMERSYIEGILHASHWRVSGPYGAAVILGLKPTTLLSRMKKLGIKKPYP